MNTDGLTQHLTDEQFGGLLAGELPDESMRIHLAACEFCRAEVEVVQESVSCFNVTSMRWAEAEAPRRVPVPSRLALRLGGRPIWGLGLATAAAGFLVAVGMSLPFGQPQHPAPTQARVPAKPTNAELAQDNRLMESIAQELRYDVQPAVPAAELRTAAPGAALNGAASVTNE